MTDPRLAPFANFWGDRDDLADAAYAQEQDDPWDADDIAFHRWQNELFDAGQYQEDEQEIFAQWGRPPHVCGALVPADGGLVCTWCGKVFKS